MEQVLINLVQNAAEAVRNSKHPEIELSCYSEPENQVSILARDNVEGIPAERMEQVFIPFFTTREKGSGIGLSLCKQIMRLHDGQLHLDSSPGKGTSVIIRF
jgi:signal transduction histidine kinase